MGGVDQNDALIAFYRVHIRSKKYYLNIFFNFIDMVIVVSWLLYRRDCDSLAIPARRQLYLLKLYCHMSPEAGQGHHPKGKRTAVNITGNSTGNEEERPNEARASSEHPHGQQPTGQL